MSGQAKCGVICCLLVMVAIFVLPLSIASIVVGAIQYHTCHNMTIIYPNLSMNNTNPIVNIVCTCDYTDVMGLNVSQYLLGLGIPSLIFACVLVICLSMVVICESPLSSIPIFVIAILNGVFGTIWFIIGAVILFRSNIQCIQTGCVHVIFALVLWCLSALATLKSICSVKITIK